MLPAQGSVHAAPVELRADTDVATAGFYQLRWHAEGAVVVQEDTTRDFASPRVIYRGADGARALSGKSDGNWYYRARTAGSDGAFGHVVEVTVRHHPIGRALAFFAVGALVFFATLAAVVKGARSA